MHNPQVSSRLKAPRVDEINGRATLLANRSCSAVRMMAGTASYIIATCSYIPISWLYFWLGYLLVNRIFYC